MTADLADRLAAAGVRVIVTVDPSQGDNACAYAACTPRIAIGDIADPAAAAGTLAHEFAHVRLGHLAGDFSAHPTTSARLRRMRSARPVRTHRTGS